MEYRVAMSWIERARAALSAPDTSKADAPELPPIEALEAPAEDIQAEAPRRRLRARGIVAIAVVLTAFAGLVFALWPTDHDGPIIRLAFVGSLSGADAEIGRAELDGVKLLVDEVNRAGGINNRKVELDVKDDRGSPETAQDIAYTIGQKGDTLAVIGHTDNATALASVPIYERFEIPVISPSATSDALSGKSKWFFRTIFNDGFQARFLARYVRFILNQHEAITITSDDAYGTALGDALGKSAVDVDVNIRRRWSIPLVEHANHADHAAVYNEIADYLQNQAPNAVVFLLVKDKIAGELLVALRDRGLANQVIGTNLIGHNSFAGTLADQPREKQVPGFYTSGVLVAMPLIYEIAEPKTLAFKEQFDRTYQEAPVWEAAFAYDAAAVVLEGVKQLNLVGGADGVRRDRASVRDFLSKLDAPEHAYPGLTGPIFFDAKGDPKKPIAMGSFQNRIISSLAQLRQVNNPKMVRDLDRKIEHGEIVNFEDQFMYRTTIVYTGLRPNGDWTIDAAHNRFHAEFDLWFRYQDDLAVADLVFPGAIGPIEMGEPIKSYALAGVNYRLYHVKGDFQLDTLKDLPPFGHHVAAIAFRNRELTSERLIYVLDPVGLPPSSDQLLAYLKRLNFLPNSAGWSIERAWAYPEMRETEPRGEPEFLDPNAERFPYSAMTLAMDVDPAGAKLRRAWDLASPVWPSTLLGILFVGLLIVDRFVTHRLLRKVSLIAYGAAGLGLLYVLEIGLIDHWLADWDRSNLDYVERLIDVLFWLMPAFLLTEFLERFVWSEVEVLFRRTVPQVVRGSMAAVIYLITILGIMAFIFHQPVTYLLAAMGIAVLIVGFAIHGSIASIFAGIALNFERAFTVGDWVKVAGHGEGWVVDIGWRATKLRTSENHMFSIPNNAIAESVIDRPQIGDGATREWIEVQVDPGVEPAKVSRTLNNALMMVRQKDNSYTSDTEVRFLGLDDWAARYRVYFAVKSFDDREEIREQVWLKIRAILHHAKIRPAIEGRADPLATQDAAAVASWFEPKALLARVPVFAAFSAPEIAQLAASAHPRVVPVGTDVVTQGDAGDSLFVIREGVMSVTIRFGDKDPVEVARLGPGDFFGEMALLAGDPRTATVSALTELQLLEITKAEIAPIIGKRREIIAALVRIMEDRKRALGQAKKESETEVDASNALANRIARFLFD